MCMNPLRKLLPNTALYRHNDDTWTVRGTIMDIGNIHDCGFTGYHKTPEAAVDAYYNLVAKKYGWEDDVQN